ncbi:MAG: cell wall hydrolase [Lachnospiraceae bacterium]|nr:cell wall hydrolase [Lachnospiraceae bacterium]
MKLGKKQIQGIVVAIALCIVTLAGVVTNQAKEDGHKKNTTAVAGVASAVSLKDEEASVEEVKVQTVALAEDEIIEEEEVQEEVKDSEWNDRMICTVEDSLNVRKKPSTKSKVVGQLLSECGAKVLEKDGKWLKIKSGNVKGYVKAKYAVVGDEAESYAEKHGLYKATAKIDGLRVRYKASTDSKIHTIVDKGSKFSLCKRACKVDEWVAVSYNGKRAFVSEEYVDVNCTLKAGYTNKEYAAKLKKEQEEKAAKAAAKAAAQAEQDSQSSGSGVTTTQQSSVSSGTDNETLLAALIYCEAGGQSYEGKVAVGAVVCNRVRSGRYPNSIRAVIYQAGQFGPASSGALARRLNSSIPDSCRRAARAALSGTDNVGGALHFQSRRSGHTGLIIGGHVFF